MKKIVLALFLILMPVYSFANSGDIIATNSYTGYIDLKGMTLDSNNNIYILQQNSGSEVYTIQVIEALYPPIAQSGSTININSSGSTNRSINDWIHELGSSDIFPLANVVILVFAYILFTLGALIYGLIYGFRFFNGKSTK